MSLGTLVKRLGRLPQATQLAFHCSYTRETIERVLISLDREELGRMIAVQDTTDVRCEFCGQRYPFSREELTRLMEERG